MLTLSQPRHRGRWVPTSTPAGPVAAPVVPGLPTSYARRDPGSRFASASAGLLPSVGAGDGAGTSSAGGSAQLIEPAFKKLQQ